MSVSDDVGNLFRRFGGDADQYQEVGRDDDAKHAALRWPLLNALDIAHPGQVPVAERAASAAPAQAARLMQEPPVVATPGPTVPPLFARGHRHASMPAPVSPTPMGAGRFSAPPATVTTVPSIVDTAANSPGASASVAHVAPTSVPSQTVFAQPLPTTPPATQPVESARVERPASMLASQQTFARSPFDDAAAPVRRQEPVAQQGGSILAGLFGAKTAEAAPAASRDLTSVFARLSRGADAQPRTLRDRLKPGGDAS
jgi:hypothetical protein